MKPLQISIWNGIVMGGGVGVSVHAPIRVATDNTVFAMPETGIGFFTDVGGSYFLPRVKSNINEGLYLGLTGHRLKSKELLQWGVATHYVPSTNLEALYANLKTKVTKASTNEEIERIVT
jgi:enoyl-CoA hydratase/carnithine racemase